MLSALVLARPEALLIALAALPIAVLYFLRMRFRRKSVGSTYIWKELAGATSGGDAMRRRSLLLLALQLAAIALAALAAAGPSIASRRLIEPGTAFIVDVSASMASRDVAAGTSGDVSSRVEAAVQEAEREMAALGPGAPVMLFACASSARPLLAESVLDKGKAIAALRGLKAGSEAFDEAGCADEIAAWLSRSEGSWQAVLLTDGGLDLGGTRLASVFYGELRVVGVGSSGASLGATGLRLERKQGGGMKASFSLWNGWPSERKAILRISRGKEELASAALTAGPGWTLAGIDVAGKVLDGAYTLDLERESGNVRSAPGATYRLAVSAQRALSVLVVGRSDPFLLAALAFGGISYTAAKEFPASLDGVDIVIAENAKPPAGERCNLLVFGDPPSDAPIVAFGGVSGTIISTEPNHPLSRFVALEGARAESATAYERRGDATVLAAVGRYPALVAWERDGYRSLACGIDLARSDLGLKSAFPILLQNFLEWASPRPDEQSAYTLFVGEAARRTEPESFKVRGAVDLLRSGPAVVLTPRQEGLFEWSADSGSGVIASNVPAGEIDIAPRALDAGRIAGTSGAASAGSQALASTEETRSTRLGAWFSLALALCLAAEWMLWKGAKT